ncbi:MAG TPA: NAD-dependent protein deacylase, partial [Sulfitobacter pontiacus]|nr:NAD-dependent protein deacylase [Sulfitobacter pontiacus]
PCPACNAPAARPDIVWFGEMPYDMDEIFDHLAEADIFAAIGTSGNVYPAAGFVAEARRNGAHTVELNLERSAVGNQFAEHRTGPATRVVTDWVEQLLATPPQQRPAL